MPFWTRLVAKDEETVRVEYAKARELMAHELIEISDDGRNDWMDLDCAAGMGQIGVVELTAWGFLRKRAYGD